MIRVLHSVSNMDRGGIETMIMNIYRNIDREKVQFDILCNKAKPGAYDEEIRRLGGNIYISPGLNPVKYFEYQKYMDKLLQENKYKVVHAHNGALGYYALTAAKRNQVPVRVFHAHGASINFDLKWPLKMLCKSNLLNVCNQHLTCGVKAARCYFGKDIVDRNDYIMINNAIDIENFVFSETIRQKIRDEHGLQDQLVIGHVGRFVKLKNHSFLIDVFKQFHALEPNSVLVFLGDGKLMEQIKKKVVQYNLQKNVLFLGSVPNVNEWYQAMDAFVLPSTSEGLPVVGIESQTAGLPCFFSDQVTSEAKITDNVCFLPIKDEQVWANEIFNTLNSFKREDMGEVISQAGYSIKAQAKLLEKLYLQWT